MVARVCKHWREVVYTPSLWQDVWATLSLERYSPLVYKDMYNSIVKRGINRFRFKSVVDPFQSTCLVEMINSVKYMDLASCVTENDIDLLMAEKLPLLTHLDIGWLDIETKLTFISKQCENLEHLKVKTSRGSPTFCEISKMYPNLKDLHFFYYSSTNTIHNDGNKALQYIAGQSPEPGVIGCLKLERLRITGPFTISHDGMEHLCSGLSSLKELEIKCGTDKELQTLAAIKTLKTLELVVSSHPHISDTGFLHLSRGAAKLVSLTIFFEGLTDECVEHLASIKTLKKLKLRWCDNISDKSLLHLARGSARLSHLSIIPTQEYGIKRFKGKISDQGLRYMLQGPGLLELCSLEVLSRPSAIHAESLKQTVSALKLLKTIKINQISQWKNVSLPYGRDRWG